MFSDAKSPNNGFATPIKTNNYQTVPITPMKTSMIRDQNYYNSSNRLQTVEEVNSTISGE